MSHSTLFSQVGFIAARSVRRTFRQPALIVPTIVFPLFLLAVNSSGLESVVKIPGFPTDNYVNFAIVVCFMQGGLFAAITAGTELATDIETGFLDRLQLTPLRTPAILAGQPPADNRPLRARVPRHPADKRRRLRPATQHQPRDGGAAGLADAGRAAAGRVAGRHRPRPGRGRHRVRPAAGSARRSGSCLLLGVALAWASASIVVIKRLGAVHLRHACRAWQMLIGGLPLLALGIGFEHRLPHPTVVTWGWFAFLVIPATAINFALWFRLLERYSATAMSSWLFLIPVFGVLSGAILLDEPIGWRAPAGGLLVVLGVVLTQRQVSQEEVVLAA